MLTAERLRELLEYNPLTGVFCWRVSRGTKRAGSAAGSLRDGYWIIRCDRKNYGAHRLAWLWIHGEWPEGEIDHRDLVRSNNVLTNLREASHSLNNANRRLRPQNAGMKGITCRKSGKWVAQIAVNGVKMGLGTYLTAEEAHAAYRQAAIAHFGDYARFQ